MAAQHWDRSKWITVFSSHSPTIREVTECLGLGLAPSASTTNRGIPKFDAPDFKKLSSEVQRLSKDLPQDRDALLDFAADPKSMEKELDELLETLGPAIWGKDADRSRLVTPDPNKKTYYKDLFYEDHEDRELIKIHLQRWIVIKACYWIRNRKLKKPSLGEEYESLADIDAGSPAQRPEQSPILTPTSGSPSVKVEGNSPTEGGAQQTAHPQKRKSSALISLSDGDDSPVSTPGSRKRSYQSHTLPIQRKSPRKSLAPRLSPENIPLHSLLDRAERDYTSTPPASDPNRPLLSPLSSNALNAAAKPANPTPSTSAVNSAPDTPATAPSSMATAHTRDNSPANANPNAPAAIAGPTGFTAVNATNSPKIPIAPNPNSYVTLHNGGHRSKGEGRMIMSKGHTESLYHPPSGARREPSPRKSPNFQDHYGPDVPPGMDHRHSGRPTGPPNGHHHHAYHHQNAPPPPYAPAYQPRLHPHAPPNGTNLAGAPILPSSTSNRHHTNGHVVERRSKSRAASPDMTLLQCELLGLLMRYFYSRDGSPQHEEPLLLQNLEYIWHRNESTFRHQLGPLYETQSLILHAWISERRKIAQLASIMDSHPGVRAQEMVDRLLAMNDLRVMRLKWKALKTQDGKGTLAPEDLLCRTFALMTRTEGTEALFKEGLDRVNEFVFEFLRTEDMKICMSRR